MLGGVGGRWEGKETSVCKCMLQHTLCMLRKNAPKMGVWCGSLRARVACLDQTNLMYTMIEEADMFLTPDEHARLMSHTVNCMLP